jgi:ribonuclease HI
VHPDDWWLLGFGWRGTWWCDQFLPFGCRTSPAIFDLFASALEWILQTQRGWEHILHYLDDFLAIFPRSAASDAPNRYKGDFSQICSDLGFRVKEEKNEEGHCIRFLGIEIDTEAMEARLPPDKHEKATALVNSTLAQHSVTHRSLETTVGFLSFASKVVPASRPFLRRLYDALTATSRTHHIRVSSEIKKDLSWWQTFLPQWNGIRLLHHPRQILRLWTDPSGQKGIGGYFLRPGETLSSIHTPAQLFSTTVPQRHKAKHINFKEMYAVLHALRTWTTESRAGRIKLHCDNEAVVAALAKGSIKGQAMNPLRQIAMHIALHDIELHCIWIPTKENALADALSRWDTEKIANLCPNLQ